jgi:hypothetical protein
LIPLTGPTVDWTRDEVPLVFRAPGRAVGVPEVVL